MAAKSTIQLIWAQVSKMLSTVLDKQCFVTTLRHSTTPEIYFDWSTPASWEQEIHIPISGANYTRLIPYTLQPQTVFDKIVLYNITIPAMTGQPTHTGVYFGNGTEVTVDTAFKVIGSTYGPGTCYNFNQNGNSYSFNGAYMPQTKAPWDNSLTVSYFITLEGDQIYSLTQFGWNGKRRRRSLELRQTMAIKRRPSFSKPDSFSNAGRLRHLSQRYNES